MLPLETVRKRMKSVCHTRQISDSAVAMMAMHIEEYIRNLTKIAWEELNHLNEFRKIQGIYQKKKLDDEAVERAITINSKNNTNCRKAGGKEKEREKRKEKIGRRKGEKNEEKENDLASEIFQEVS